MKKKLDEPPSDNQSSKDMIIPKYNKQSLWFIGLFLWVQLQQADCQNPNYLEYAPFIPEHTPIKFIRLNFHIFQKKDSSGNFANNAESRAFIQRLVSTVNDKYGNLAQNSLQPVHYHIKDSRIRFVLDSTDIYFWQDDKANDMYKNHNLTERVNQAESAYLSYCKNSKTFGRAIHVLLGEGDPSANYQSVGVASGIGDGRWLVCVNFYRFFQQKPSNFWIPANTLAHELGHNLGLLHPLGPNNSATDDGCDDTPTAPLNTGCWNGDNCSNNMMDYNASQANLTPCQLGRIHYYLTSKRNNLQTVLIENWCDISQPEIFIRDTVYWRVDKRLNSGVRVKKGGVLNIDSEIHFPYKAGLVIEKGGTVRLGDRAHLTHVCNGFWQGIKYLGKKGTLNNALCISSKSKISKINPKQKPQK